MSENAQQTDAERLIAAALAWHDEGFCVLPAAADGSKRPGLKWDAYKTARPAREQVAVWAAQADGIGMVCGAVSGNVEMLEIEGKAADLLEPFIAAVDARDPFLARALLRYWETTPSGGIHFLYRVTGGPVAGNTKLASRPKLPTPTEPSNRDTLLETRGEGGWTVLAPSAGRTHPTGKAWKAVVGGPADLAVITAEQRDVLHEVARTFDQMPEVVIGHREARPVIDGDLSPGQDFEQRMSWADILGPEGWTLCERHGDKDLWTRPGKDRKHGASATTNYDGNDNLYVFSSSTAFEPNSSYTKFGAYALLRHGGDFSAAARALRAEGYGSAPKASTGEAQAESRAMLDLLPEGAPTTFADSTAPASGEEKSSPARKFDLSDVGNAHRLIEVEGPRLRYSPERKEWLHWNEGRWHWNASDAPAIRAMWRIVEMTKAADPDEGKWLFKSQSATAIEKAVRLARTDDRLLVSMSDLDARPFELNTPSGVVDLTTTELRPPEPSAMHTRVTGVAVDFSAACPRWLAFLEETFSGDAELIGFVQRLAGYSATGKVTHHVLPFLHGGGANGKSVFLEVLIAVLGTYAGPAPADFLLAGGNVHESYTADLAGMRLVVCSEVGPAAKFHEQKIKHLTGGDIVKARFLYGKPFSFVPTHHMWLMGNHQPAVDAGGESFWRRLRLIPFLHTVPEAERIAGLATQLVEQEGPAILAWVVEGARQQLAGLNEPESVKAATSSYAEEEDHLGLFIEERIKFGGGDYVRISTTDMRHAYEQWCFGEGTPPIPANVFGREIKARGAGTAKSNGKRFYTNVTIMRPEDSIAPRPEQLRYGD
jgi:putative DNA primase/helicase